MNKITDTILLQDLQNVAVFPKVHSSVSNLWGTMELYEYLSNLLVDTRSHTRKGFPKEVVGAILNLHRANIGVLEAKGFNFPNFEIIFNFKRG